MRHMRSQIAVGMLGLVGLCATVVGQCEPGEIFSPDVTYDVGIRPTSVAIGDLDDDGVPDLAVSLPRTGARMTCQFRRG